MIHNIKFEKIAPFLSNPLVLIGFVLMILFGVYSQLLEAKIIPTLTQEQGSAIVSSLLNYGFWLVLLVVVFGFSLMFYRTYLKTKIKTQQQDAVPFDNLSKNDLPNIANPRLNGKVLQGRLKGFYSYPVGDYRLIFQIEGDRLTGFVPKVVHYKEIHKQ